MCISWLRVSEHDMLLYGDSGGSVHTYAVADEWGSESDSPGGVETGMSECVCIKLRTVSGM